MICIQRALDDTDKDQFTGKDLLFSSVLLDHIRSDKLLYEISINVSSVLVCVEANKT